ncbi:MAG: VWA domain-containing protein, partial [Bacteroidota bacterium]
VIFFSDTIEKFIPPKKGKQHILRIIRELINFEPKQSGTDLGQALEYLNNVIKKRSICFILSDFMTKDYETPLRIAGKRHDVVGVHLYDPREEELPNIGLMRAVDAETGRVQWIDTSVQAVRENYAAWFQDNQQYFRSSFLKSGSDVLSVRTDESYIKVLHQFFKKRAG